ncbi:hypothetical protein CBP31_13275 [Oceanisphaera profunda]|uniref:Uncharacterized protein n=1 Tax=Oceanisphaera profunda TaxID=1416627 RepID=A0A1Y0D879_9GAMM|nr:hypothetical protein CBP31_13275 [Oceanisphaera profunda]
MFCGVNDNKVSPVKFREDKLRATGLTADKLTAGALTGGCVLTTANDGAGAIVGISRAGGTGRVLRLGERREEYSSKARQGAINIKSGRKNSSCCRASRPSIVLPLYH